jgi:hypothetical protein
MNLGETSIYLQKTLGKKGSCMGFVCATQPVVDNEWWEAAQLARIMHEPPAQT